MSEDQGDVEVFDGIWDALAAAGLIPVPISGLGSEETDEGEDLAVLSHRVSLSADDEDRIRRVMGTVAYRLEHLIEEPDGTWRRASDGTVVGGWLRG